MVKPTQLSNKWIKASILGTIWAASEIVLGSFLHNLRLPFSGNFLTAIGIIILVSASFKWNERGLFWRAGVICALLKTMSPSAAIFGPMIAIIIEAVLMETGTFIFGKTTPGLILGSVLAMSWNLFHKVFRLILFYGNNIIEVYANLMSYAEKQMGLQFDAVWTPLLLLLIIQILFGATAALIGIRTGRDTLIHPITFQQNIEPAKLNKTEPLNKFSYSVWWMYLNLFLMIGSLLLIGRINFGVWVLLVLAISGIWAVRYKRALKQLMRPRLWIFIVLITMITALTFTQIKADSISLSDALLIGVEMNLRALILLIGFTVLGTELYNPKIRNYFAKSYFKQIPVALQLSLSSLPTVIANTPNVKNIAKNPTAFVNFVMSYAEYRLNEINNNNVFHQKIYLISGGLSQGKTSTIKNMLPIFIQNKISVSGIYSERVIENEMTIGYNVVDISSGKSSPFLRKTGNENQKRIGNYFVDNDGCTFGKNALRNTKTDFVIIDEVGRLETSGEGWSEILTQILNSPTSHLILSVRNKFTSNVCENFNIKPTQIFNISDENYSEISEQIINDFEA